MRIHLVRYSVSTADGPLQGIARIPSDRKRPSWRECAARIDGFITGEYLGLAPMFTLRFATASGPVEKILDSVGVERIGAVVMRGADRGEAWDVEVRDESGVEVTFDFPCFS